MRFKPNDNSKCNDQRPRASRAIADLIEHAAIAHNRAGLPMGNLILECFGNGLLLTDVIAELERRGYECQDLDEDRLPLIMQESMGHGAGPHSLEPEPVQLPDNLVLYPVRIRERGNLN